MKLNFKNSPTITSDDMEVSKMGLAEESAELFQYYLRSKIYSDKVLAPIREYICNALDEHIKYDIDKPVEVKLEQLNGQYTWSCRDYGKGLSESDIRNIFCMYGRSTKRNTNTQIGSFGLGSKSFMAYTDSFFITSHFEGMKTQYACMLSAGDNGVPVGEIYKVYEEPTDETGIEVSADVTNDWTTFAHKTQTFVEQFPENTNVVFTDYIKSVFKPISPIRSKTVDNFTINLYDAETTHLTHYFIHVRMGGVIYPCDHRYMGMSIDSNLGIIVVDVPIGFFSIPISRESIENTPANQANFSKIAKLIGDLRNEERSTFVTPKFGDTVLGNKYTARYLGEWFAYSFAEIFKDTAVFRNGMQYLHTGWNHNIVNGKYTIYLIPNIKSYKSWISRLDLFIGQICPNTQIAYRFKTQTDPVSTDTLDLSDVNFVDVKKLGLPKLPKSEQTQKYLVYYNGYKKGSFTAEELDEHVTSKYFNDADIVDGWENSVDNIDLLRMRVIGLASDHGQSHRFWITNSKKMKEQLLELGWFDLNSPEYKKRIEELNHIATKKANVENAEYRAKSAMFKTKPSARTIGIIANNPDKVKRLERVRDLLRKEDTFRGRLLNSIESYYPKITREDLRKILTMK